MTDFKPKIKFIGEPPADQETYLRRLYKLVDEAAEGDPGEAEDERPEESEPTV